MFSAAVLNLAQAILLLAAAAEVEHLMAQFHVYLTKDGRISMAGLNEGNVRALVGASAQERGGPRDSGEVKEARPKGHSSVLEVHRNTICGSKRSDVLIH